MNKLLNLQWEQVTENTSKLNFQKLNELFSELIGWEIYQKEDALHLKKEFKFKDFGQAAFFSSQVARIADEKKHHPTILTDSEIVMVTWCTHKIMGLHQNDFIMAAKTDQLY
jgi:4a-hydroxytetrahydrobiopterin dehydratase